METQASPYPSLVKTHDPYLHVRRKCIMLCTFLWNFPDLHSIVHFILCKKSGLLTVFPFCITIRKEGKGIMESFMGTVHRPIGVMNLYV
jgi:hypothetical protein